ncbi:MAG: mobilization protein [Legionella sp.]|nr:mobilization protein [Legionella sp.]
MADSSSKIEALKQKQQVLQARIQQLEAREKVKQRKQDTRRKILIGAYILDKAEKEGTLTALYQEMGNYIQREADKPLFEMKVEEAMEA